MGMARVPRAEPYQDPSASSWREHARGRCAPIYRLRRTRARTLPEEQNEPTLMRLYAKRTAFIRLGQWLQLFGLLY